MAGKGIKWGAVIAGALAVTAVAAACIFALPEVGGVALGAEALSTVGTTLATAATEVGSWISGMAASIAETVAAHPTATLGVVFGGATAALAAGSAKMGKNPDGYAR